MSDFTFPSVVPPPISGGLMLGNSIGSAFSTALQTYMQRKDINDRKAMEKQQMQIMMSEKGLMANPDTGEIVKDPQAQTDKNLSQQIDFLKTLPEDQRAGSAFGQRAMGEVANRIFPKQQTQGLMQPQEAIPGADPNAAPPPPPAASGNQFGLLPDYKSKKEREMQDFIQKTIAGETIKNQIGKTLPAEEAAKVGKANASFTKLDDLEKTIKGNGDSFGPFAGRVNAINPYDTTSQSLKSQQLAAIQDIGTYLEGGKLTDADIPKYQKMMPALNDTPEVALEKVALMRKLVQDKQREEVAALKGAGYRTGGLKTGSAGSESNLLNGKVGNGAGLVIKKPAKVPDADWKSLSPEGRQRLVDHLGQ